MSSPVTMGSAPGSRRRKRTSSLPAKAIIAIMTDSSIVSIVFQDLMDAHDELSGQDTSPKQVRRSFGKVIELSQKLTASMRKEFSKRTGGDWVASDFEGWNDTTALFKQLRNEDQHERPVGILVHERQYFKVFEDTPELVFKWTWSFSLEDQLADSPRDDLRLVLPDPETGRPSEQRIVPVRREYEFHLAPSSKKAKDLLTRIGDPNVQSLSDKCLKVLNDYYQYYQRQLT